MAPSPIPRPCRRGDVRWQFGGIVCDLFAVLYRAPELDRCQQSGRRWHGGHIEPSSASSVASTFPSVPMQFACEFLGAETLILGISELRSTPAIPCLPVAASPSGISHHASPGDITIIRGRAANL